MNGPPASGRTLRSHRVSSVRLSKASWPPHEGQPTVFARWTASHEWFGVVPGSFMTDLDGTPKANRLMGLCHEGH